MDEAFAAVGLDLEGDRRVAVELDVGDADEVVALRTERLRDDDDRLVVGALQDVDVGLTALVGAGHRQVVVIYVVALVIAHGVSRGGHRARSPGEIQGDRRRRSSRRAPPTPEGRLR